MGVRARMRLLNKFLFLFVVVAVAIIIFPGLFETAVILPLPEDITSEEMLEFERTIRDMKILASVAVGLIIVCMVFLEVPNQLILRRKEKET